MREKKKKKTDAPAAISFTLVKRGHSHAGETSILKVFTMEQSIARMSMTITNMSPTRLRNLQKKKKLLLLLLHGPHKTFLHTQPQSFTQGLTNAGL